MQHHAVTERLALTETLRRADPESQTLCGEWSTAELTAHLVLRERSVIELGGRLPVAALQRRAERAVDELAAREPYDRLVDTFGRGPSWRELRGPMPIAWFWSLPPVTEAANLLEYVVHHEDVRRAQEGWEPRLLPIDTQVAVWKRLHLLARATLRSVPVGLALVWPSHSAIHSRSAKRDGRAAVSATGDPVELALLAFGRLPQARVEWGGSPADVEAVRSADISL